MSCAWSLVRPGGVTLEQDGRNAIGPLIALPPHVRQDYHGLRVSTA
jgi:hypothetical protein